MAEIETSREIHAKALTQHIRAMETLERDGRDAIAYLEHERNAVVIQQEWRVPEPTTPNAYEINN